MNVPPAAAAPEASGGSRPRGFTSPEAARIAALAFIAEGITPGYVRARDSRFPALLAELAGTMDALAAQGVTCERARETAGMAALPADGPR